MIRWLVTGTAVTLPSTQRPLAGRVYGCITLVAWMIWFGIWLIKKLLPSHFSAPGVLIPRPSIQLMTAADLFSTVILYYNQIYRMLGIPATLANTLFGFNPLEIFYIFGCVVFFLPDEVSWRRIPTVHVDEWWQMLYTQRRVTPLLLIPPKK